MMLTIYLCLITISVIESYMLKGALRFRCSSQNTLLHNMRAASQFQIRSKSTLTDGDELLSTDLLALKDNLIALRTKTRLELQKPAYVVFTNKALAEIIEKIPTSENEIDLIRPSNAKILKAIYPDILMLTARFKGVKIAGDVSKLPAGSKEAVLPVIPLQTAEIVQPTTPVKTPLKTTIKTTKAVIQQAPEPITTDSDVSLTSYSPGEIPLSDLTFEQQEAAERAMSGQNLFITGSAGTGKSFLMRYIVQEMRRKYEGKSKNGESGEVVVTAPTGVAAINVGGQTIHSFAGIGQMKFSNAMLKGMVLKNKKSRARWGKCKVLIIDEVSMLSASLFDLLDDIAKAAKGNKDPFGGVQLILVGDFLQLPPIINPGPEGTEGDTRKFCFQTHTWRAAGLSKADGGTVQLEEVIRQKHDRPFVNVLNEIRKGRISRDTIDVLNKCLLEKKKLPTDGITPTQLYCYNTDVDFENKKNLDKLPGDVFTLTANDVWKDKPPTALAQKALVDTITKSAPLTIELKVGAQVMLLRNSREKGDDSKLGLVNGSRGVVVRFEAGPRTGIVPVVRFDNGKVTAIRPVEYEQIDSLTGCHIVRSQVPLKLAWAITVHKSQGTTLSRAQLMIRNTFDSGQAYVALSRVTGFEGLWLTKPLTKESIRADQDALEYYGYSTFDD